MIHIDRDRLDDEGRPVRPDDAWFSKALEATETAKREGDRHQVQEHVYRHPSVKVALEELFYRKCAYCETPLSEVGWQVEHFRPKGRVAERLDHPGYYWLAYEWTNLYPSCAPCNQKLEDKPTWDDPESGTAHGKADQFPLDDEATRAMSHEDSLGSEKPLLLDPCADQPEEHLIYTPLGEIGPTREGDRRVETSLTVFHLTRRRLRDRRKQHIELVVLVLKRLERFKEINPEEALTFEKELEEKLFADSAPFAGVARCVRNDPVAFGIKPLDSRS